MQVTGSSTELLKQNAKLSIRLRQDGQFCSVEEALEQGVAQGTTVEVMVDGAVCVPFPRREMEHIDLKDLVIEAGVPLSESDALVVSLSDSPIGYALAIDGELKTRLDEWSRQYSVSLNFTTPLSGVVARAVVGTKRDKCVVVQRTPQALYIAYTAWSRVSFVEALPLQHHNSDEDALYALAVMNDDFDLRKADIIIIGMDARRQYKVLRRYFRHCSCE